MSEFIRHYEKISNATSIGDVVTSFPVRSSEVVSISELENRITSDQTVIIVTSYSERCSLETAETLKSNMGDHRAEIVSVSDFMEDVPKRVGSDSIIYALDKCCNRLHELLKSKKNAILSGRFPNMQMRSAVLNEFKDVAEMMACVYVEPQSIVIFERMYNEAYEEYMNDPRKLDMDTLLSRKQREIQVAYEYGIKMQRTYNLGVDVYAKTILTRW